MSMHSYTSASSTKSTPQSEPIPGSSQVENSAGGFAWELDCWGRLDRFLVLGSDAPTYYASARKLTKENASAVRDCLQADGKRLVDRIVEISTGGRAPKNDPALFALAMAMKLGDDATRAHARAALPKVARIGTHLFHLAEAVQAFGGWGRGTKRAFAEWYTKMPADRLALQLVKYQQRDGWAHRDILRLSKPKKHERGAQLDQMLAWAAGKGGAGSHPLIDASERTKAAKNGAEMVTLIRGMGLPRECVPSQWLNSPAVWEALLMGGRGMPMTAMIRNLAKMTTVGLLAPGSQATQHIIERLGNEEFLQRARIHPLSVLVALRTYGRGRGVRGSLQWTPVPQIVDALDAAFYDTFRNVVPTGKRILLALDVSGSMTSPDISGMPGISPRVGSAAMAMVTLAAEENAHVVGFYAGSGGVRFASGRSSWGGVDGVTPLDISPRRRLDDVINSIAGLPFGGTDCALPMRYAQERGLDIDAFVIYTDSETWAGTPHPSQALQEYRRKHVADAKLITVGMTSNGFTIADPNDPGMLDVVGFDTATPNIMSQVIGD